MRAALSLLLVFWVGPAWACTFDTDCAVGSRCVKGFGQLNGICAGGMNPGNSYDKKPTYNPLDINKTYGNTCQFDVDCGPGSKCLKSGLKGVCVR